MLELVYAMITHLLFFPTLQILQSLNNDTNATTTKMIIENN